MRILTFWVCTMITFFSFPLMAEKVETERAQFRSPSAVEPKDNLYFSLTATDNSFDRFYLTFADSYSENYRGSEDAVALSTYYDDQPALYCLHDGSGQPLAMNGLPMKENRSVKVGFSVPQGGTYTFKLEIKKRTDLRSAELIDSENGKRIDLRKTPSYTFTTTGQVRANITRFTVLINTVDIDPGNTLPGTMAVAGKMYISGPMRSEGAVHIFAANAVDTGKVDIDNTTSKALLAVDTIYLYSNDVSDGLLRNMNEKGGGVKGIYDDQNYSERPKQITLRKSIADAAYTYVSLPFDVVKTNVKNGTTPLYPGDAGMDYWAVEFDPQARSNESTVETEKTFVEVNYDQGFVRGKGYAIYYNTGGQRAYMDFTTTNATEIDSLFAPKNKVVPFTVHAVDQSAGWKNPEYGDGWAFIGGRSTTTSTLASGNVGDYGGSSVWYRNEKTAQAMGTRNSGYNVIVLNQGETLNVGPYTPFWIQDTISVPGQERSSSFTFKFSGLSLESAQYRSIDDNPMKDRLYFALSSDKDNSFDRFYVVFADNYSEGYKPSEDAVTMITSFENSPAVWSLQEGTDKELVLNGLPMKDERKIRMGFSVPEAGDYTLSLDALKQTDVRNVILVDNVTGKKVDLLQTLYSFNTAGKVENENNRFTLYINSSYTNIPAVESGLPFAYIKDNLLTIKNLLEGNTVQVYDLSGRIIASGQVSGKEFSTVLGQKGVYVVNVKGEKTTVLKVLNK